MTDRENMNCSSALTLLLEGNRRFASGLRSIETIASTAYLKDLAENGQKPFAIVLTCSDSRVPAEMIFDRGLGDLFVIRVAGNIIAPSLLASIEFAATSFGTPLCVVMGHSGCGAVKAAIGAEMNGDHPGSPNLQKLVAKVKPAVRSVVRKNGGIAPQNLLDLATIANVQRTAELIERESPIVRKLIDSGKFLIAGAVYDLHTGRVHFEGRYEEASA